MLNITKHDEIREVRRLKENDNLTFQDIANKLGFSERTARRRYEAALLESALDGLVSEELDTFPDYEEQEQIQVKSDFIPEDKGPIDRLQPIVVTGDAMVTGDYHIPLHDPKLLNVMIRAAKEQKINQLIIAGDLFHMEKFGSFLPHQEEASFPQERYDGNVVMKTLCRSFDNIIVTWGNHDYRLTKATGYQHSFTECMKRMLNQLTDEERSKIQYSDLDYLYYYPGSLDDDMYRICHPQNYSDVPLTTPRAFANKYKCGVITAHSHHCAIGVAHNGVDLCIELGGFFYKERTEYIHRSNKNHEWVPGFVMFKDQIPTLIGPAFNNTRKYRR